MNLIKLFNHKFLFQNIKKSAGVLGLFLGIIPILNTVIFLIASTSHASGYVMTFNDLSTIVALGLYFVPTILSVCLFGYMFKKKSIDFIGSMPISRKSIYVTNTIGGIAILIAMILINVILIFIANLFFSLTIISGKMLLDYILLWSVSYIFVFAISNLAMALSGNMITGIAVSLLIAFFVPFVTDFSKTALNTVNDDYYIECVDKECQPYNYVCNTNNCNNLENKNLYETSSLSLYDQGKYTTPYNLFRNSFLTYGFNQSSLYSFSKIILMIILSVIYSIVGLFVFAKRKMEVSETSFGNFKVHTFVKSLTMVPIGFIAYGVIKYSDGLFLNVFMIALMFVYYLIFDLITRKRISNIKCTIIGFVISTAVIFGYCYPIFDKTEDATYTILSEDIDSIVISNVYSDSEGILNMGEVEDKEIINLLLKNILTTERESSKGYYYISLNIKSNNKNYLTSSAVKYEDMEQVFKYLKNKDNNNSALVTKDTYAYGLNDTILNKDKDKELISLIKDSIKKLDIKDYFGDNTYTYKSLAQIKLYSYDNFSVSEYKLSASINKELEKKVIEYFNSKMSNNIKNINNNSASVNVELGDTAYGLSADQIISYINEHIEDEIDVNKEYAKIEITIYPDNMTYDFYTNDIESLNKFIKETYPTAYEDGDTNE